MEQSNVLDLIKQLRKNGVEYYKNGEVEIRLDLYATEKKDEKDPNQDENDLLLSAGLRVKAKDESNK